MFAFPPNLCILDVLGLFGIASRFESSGLPFYVLRQIQRSDHFCKHLDFDELTGHFSDNLLLAFGVIEQRSPHKFGSGPAILFFRRNRNV